MSKHRKRTPPGRRTPPRQQHLDKFGTDETEPSRPRRRTDDINTDTPYFGDRQEKPFIVSENVSKTISIISTIIGLIAIIGGGIYFYARLETNVEHLQDDVKEIKSETKDLVERTTEHGSVLNNLEKSMNDIQLQLRKNNSQSKRAPVNSEK